MRVTDVSKGKYGDINMKDKSVINKNHHYAAFIGALLICIFAIGIFHFYRFEGENIATKNHHQSSKDTLEQSSEQSFKPKETKFLSGKNRPTFLDILKQENLEDFIPLSNDLHKPLLANIETFNNVHLTPRLQSIISMDFFRYVKLNLNRECKLWSNDDRCSLRLVNDRILIASSSRIVVFDGINFFIQNLFSGIVPYNFVINPHYHPRYSMKKSVRVCFSLIAIHLDSNNLAFLINPQMIPLLMTVQLPVNSPRWIAQYRMNTWKL